MTYQNLFVVVVLDHLAITGHHLAKVTTHANSSRPPHLHRENFDSSPGEETSNSSLNSDNKLDLSPCKTVLQGGTV